MGATMPVYLAISLRTVAKHINVIILMKRKGVPEMGTKPPKALRGYRASKRGSNQGSKGL